MRANVVPTLLKSSPQQLANLVMHPMMAIKVVLEFVKVVGLWALVVDAAQKCLNPEILVA